MEIPITTETRERLDANYFERVRLAERCSKEKNFLVRWGLGFRIRRLQRRYDCILTDSVIDAVPRHFA